MEPHFGGSKWSADCPLSSFSNVTRAGLRSLSNGPLYHTTMSAPAIDLKKPEPKPEEPQEEQGLSNDV